MRCGWGARSTAGTPPQQGKWPKGSCASTPLKGHGASVLSTGRWSAAICRSTARPKFIRYVRLYAKPIAWPRLFAGESDDQAVATVDALGNPTVVSTDDPSAWCGESRG